jgi:hypothetical protein
MNTWEAYALRSPALVVLHSVPPLVVFVAAEAVTDLRDKLGAAVSAAFVNAEPAPAPAVTTAVVRRMSFADYLGVARATYRPGVAVTPAWIREVTGCSRGLSSRLAATLRAEVDGREREVRS